MNRGSNMQNERTDWDLDIWPLNPKTVRLLGYLKVIPYTKFEHFGIIRFWVMLWTNRQTDSKILPTPTDIISMGNNCFLLFQCCSHRGKSLSSRTNLQVLVLGPLDHKVLENFQGLRILQTVRYVWSCDIHNFSYHHHAWGYGEECLTYWFKILTDMSASNSHFSQ